MCGYLDLLMESEAEKLHFPWKVRIRWGWGWGS